MVLHNPFHWLHSPWASAQLQATMSHQLSNSSSAQAANVAAVAKPLAGMTYANNF